MRELLGDIDVDLLPPLLEASRRLLLAVAEMSSLFPDESSLGTALDHANRAIEIHPEMYGARLIRAAVHNQLGDFQKALADLEVYHQLLGADAEMLIQLAMALDGLARQPEAIEALRAAIALSKQQGSAVAHLFHLLPLEERDEAIKAYNDLLDPEVWIETLADDLWYYEDVPALVLLREAHAERCPEDEWGLSYLDDVIEDLSDQRKPLPDFAE